LVSSLLAEFSPTAGIVTSADLTTVELLNDATSTKILLFFEFVVYGFILWFLVQEIVKVSLMKSFLGYEKRIIT
jgi:Polycystin cation channel